MRRTCLIPLALLLGLGTIVSAAEENPFSPLRRGTTTAPRVATSVLLQPPASNEPASDNPASDTPLGSPEIASPSDATPTATVQPPDRGDQDADDSLMQTLRDRLRSVSPPGAGPGAGPLGGAQQNTSQLGGDRIGGNQIGGGQIGGGPIGDAGAFGLSLESIYGPDRLATVEGEQLRIPSLIVPTTSLEAISEQLPDDVGAEVLAYERPLPEGFDREGNWALTAYFWQAPNTYSNPLYFEDVMLERHGHERWGCLQPVASGLRFFGTVPALPYLMAVRPPCECEYHLGYYPIGSCAPNLLQRPPYDRRGIIVQAAATTGFVLICP